VRFRALRLTSVLLIGCGSSQEKQSDDAPDGGADASVEPGELKEFSFFVTSLASLQELSAERAGFGGDLRFGEQGEGAGLRGADKICTTIAELSMPGSGAKDWRAFLSTSRVDAKDRVGQGPWYDRKGRLIAETLDDLLNERPRGADPQIINDLPNEFGVPNHDPDGTGNVDNHDMLTGSNGRGTLYCPQDSASCTCDDWTSSARSGRPRVGHSWPRTVMRADGTVDLGFGDAGDLGGLGGLFGGAGGGIGQLIGGLFGDGGFPPFFVDGGLPPSFAGFGDGGLPPFPGFADGGLGGFGAGLGLGSDGSMNNWMSALDEAGCAPGVSLIEMGPPDPNNASVGSGGGYGGFFCFALSP
jgi:hypothetical protein